MTEDEKFFAWLDGELAPTEAAEMEAKVAADAQLVRLADQHRALKMQLGRAFDPVAIGPVPAHLRAALRPSAQLFDFAGAKRARQTVSVSQWTALAATLALGVFLGTTMPPRGEAPIKVQGGKMYAAAELTKALDTQLASAPRGEVRIGLTFRGHGGEICRSFTQEGSSGVACRNSGGWLLKGLFAAPEGQDGNYRMAAGPDPNLSALVDSTIAGEPLDATQEKAAMHEGWR